MNPVIRHSLNNSKAAVQNVHVADENEAPSAVKHKLQLQHLNSTYLLSSDLPEPKKFVDNKRSALSPYEQNKNVTTKHKLNNLSGLVKKKAEKCKVVQKLSPFEILRQKNLEENIKILDDLELPSYAPILVPPSEEAKPLNKVLKQRDPAQLVPPRKSARLNSSSIDALSSNFWYQKNLESSSGFYLNVDDIEINENLKVCFKELVGASEVRSSNDMKNYAKDEVLECLQKLVVVDSAICRIGSICDQKFHPSKDKILIVTADNFSNLGFWDVNKESNGLFSIRQHSGAIRHIDFCPNDSTKLFTCSNDGALNCLDLVASKFSSIWRNADTEKRYHSLHSFDFLYDKQTICVDQSGKIFIVDPRCLSTKTNDLKIEASTDTKANAVVTFAKDLQRISCLSAHPKKPYILSSGSTVKLFDIRSAKNPCIDELYHGKATKAAFFSPVTGDKILTTDKDSHLRVFDSTNLSSGGVKKTLDILFPESTKQRPTCFQAVWHPKCEDLFIVGSLINRHNIEVFSTSNYSPVLNLTGTGRPYDRTAFHPHLDMVVGTTSSGSAIASLWR